MASTGKFWLMPPQILWLLLGLCCALHWGAGWGLPFRPLPGLGLLLVVAGVGVNLWAVRTFSAQQTTVRPDERPTAVVESGPFRWSRNPMYAGLVVFYVGIACAVGSATFLISAGVFGLILRIVFITHEEAVVRAQFGEAYDAYCARVGRWIGRRPEPEGRDSPVRSGAQDAAP